jgi:hypothetical protein
MRDSLLVCLAKSDALSRRLESDVALRRQVEAVETERIKSDSGRVYLIVQGPMTKTLTHQYTMKRENV